LTQTDKEKPNVEDVQTLMELRGTNYNSTSQCNDALSGNQAEKTLCKSCISLHFSQFSVFFES